MGIARNKKARYNYEILESLEAGIELTGTEVKSLRSGHVNISDSYARFMGNQLYAINMHIDPYENATHFNHEPTRSRRLLMHRRELDKLIGKLQQKGWLLVPLKLYFKGNRVKVELGLARSKKKYDKRATIKERDQKRESEREMKEFRY